MRLNNGSVAASYDTTAADEVAAIVADVALATSRNGVFEIAGPQRAPSTRSSLSEDGR
jgi:hypothetical protein